MTEEEFTLLWNQESSDVADMFYPSGDPRRGEYLRDQAVLHVKLLEKLKETGIVK